MEGAKRVVAIERDVRALPALAEIAAAYPGRLEVISGDALDPSWRARVEGPARIVANLPYNIATPLLVGWLTSEPWPPWYRSLTLMFQKEVAERITAKPGNKAYGRLAVLAQWRAVATKLFDIDRRAFSPPPNVTSSVVHIVPGAPVAAIRVETLERVTAAAFGQRRKMLRQSLKSLGVSPEALLEAAGIEPTRRAEELDVSQFCKIAELLETKLLHRD
jgi:16S rRNA (adenine1518-N6/adenine1519-N6)-dimethyltransferase